MSKSLTAVCRYSLFLVFAALFLVMAGGLVTSHEAGLAVPDWPLSFGKFFPKMEGGVFWEHGHRMIAGTVGVLTAVLFFWVLRTAQNKKTRRLAGLSLALVVVQALFGGATVLLKLPPAISISHATIGQAFLASLVLVCTALYVEKNSALAAPVADLGKSAKLQKIWSRTVVFIFIQLVLGGIVRHTGSSHALYTHLFFAAAVAAHLFIGLKIILKDFPGEVLMLRTSAGIMAALFFQIFLGLGAWVLTFWAERPAGPTTLEVIVTTAHQTIGALILGLTVFVAALISYKRTEMRS